MVFIYEKSRFEATLIKANDTPLKNLLIPTTHGLWHSDTFFIIPHDAIDPIAIHHECPKQRALCKT